MQASAQCCRAPGGTRCQQCLVLTGAGRCLVLAGQYPLVPVAGARRCCLVAAPGGTSTRCCPVLPGAKCWLGGSQCNDKCQMCTVARHLVVAAPSKMLRSQEAAEGHRRLAVMAHACSGQSCVVG